MTTIGEDQVRVEYDDSQLDVVGKINRVLRQRGLALVDDGLLHDGYVILTLRSTATTATTTRTLTDGG